MGKIEKRVAKRSVTEQARAGVSGDGRQAPPGVGLLAEDLRKKALLLTHAIHGATEQAKEYCKPELDLWEEMLPVYELALDVAHQAKQLEATIGLGR